MYTKVNARCVSMIGVLVALEIVLSRFTIHTWNLKIGFCFVPVVVAAIFYGPVAAGLVGAIGDVLSAVLFPVGVFFPGFTLTAFLTGVVFGALLKKRQTLPNVLLSVGIVQLVLSQGLNTFFISLFYGSPFASLFFTRIYQTLIMSAVQVAGIVLISKKLIPMLRRYEDMR
ncbi:MAG: folate family ECF transporter S component [Roseburia sp.]|nr:folate family ECF transporter S component [Roseburia sp.]